MDDTGLKDSYGTPIKDGDTIEWTYYKHGIMMKRDDGTEFFMGCVTADGMFIKEFKETQRIQYEVRDNSAGYFLDVPSGIAMRWIKDEPKCKVINHEKIQSNIL